MSDKYKTPAEWAEKSDLSRWEISRTTMDGDGKAVDVWICRAHHHAFFQTFVGPDAVRARELHRIAKAMERVKKAEADLESAKAELAEVVETPTALEARP